jgi:CBS domain-containing protein
MNIASILATKGASVVSIRPDQSVREAVALLARHNIGALVVVDDAGRSIGILSERDVVREAARDEQVFARAVSEIMTSDVVTAMPEDDLMSVASTMTARHIRHLPVVDKGNLVGIVSIGDVLKAQRDRFLGEIDTLESQLLADQG